MRHYASFCVCFLSRPFCLSLTNRLQQRTVYIYIELGTFSKWSCVFVCVCHVSDIEGGVSEEDKLTSMLIVSWRTVVRDTMYIEKREHHEFMLMKRTNSIRSRWREWLVSFFLNVGHLATNLMYERRPRIRIRWWREKKCSNACILNEWPSFVKQSKCVHCYNFLSICSFTTANHFHYPNITILVLHIEEQYKHKLGTRLSFKCLYERVLKQYVQQTVQLILREDATLENNANGTRQECRKKWMIHFCIQVHRDIVCTVCACEYIDTKTEHKLWMNGTRIRNERNRNRSTSYAITRQQQYNSLAYCNCFIFQFKHTNSLFNLNGYMNTLIEKRNTIYNCRSHILNYNAR